MPDDRFDDLTKLVSKSTSRRGLLKGAAAAALGGVAMRLRGSGDAAARARVKMACARLGQPCGTGPGTPGDHICCPDLTCGADAVCCKDTNAPCVTDADCCADADVCRPNPNGLGNRCLEPGLVGAKCIEDTDCAGGLACELESGLCGEVCGDVTCLADQTCDPYTLTCVGNSGAPCLDDSECASGNCDPYTLTCLDCTAEYTLCLSDAECCGDLVCAPNLPSGSISNTYCVECLADGLGCIDARQCCTGVCILGSCGPAS
jgi:hypothetical protein